jgi:hypothetical protein
MTMHKYSKKFNPQTQVWDIFLDEEECSTYICSFGHEHEADMLEFLNFLNAELNKWRKEKNDYNQPE